MKDYIIRKKTGKVVKYYDKRGNILSKKKAESYLNAYIPPGYDNVKINKRRGKIRAIGYDDKNRPQYIYDKNYTSKRSCLKFKDLIEFGKNYKKIFDKIQKDLYTTSETKEKQIATILMLIIECDFRVGNDKYTRDNKSYGATTLEKRHVKSKSGKIYIDFIGKKGVKNTCELKNKKLIKNIKTKKKSLKKNDRIFKYRINDKYYNINSSDVNKYLKNMGDYSTKYFRTWSANVSLIKLLKQNKTLKESVEETANKLHHTSAICKKNYLDPKLINYYEKNKKKFINYFKGDENEKYYEFLKSKY